MTQRSALTPHAALGWLGSLSIDIAAAAVLDANGAVLAGDPALERAGDPAVEPAGGGPGLISARSDRHAIVVRIGPKALERLVRADLQAALEALERR